MAPCQARAQVFAQRQVDGRHTACGRHRYAARGRFDEERESGVLLVGIEPVAGIDHDQRPGLVERPRRGVARVEPAGTQAVLFALVDQRLE